MVAEMDALFIRTKGRAIVSAFLPLPACLSVICLVFLPSSGDHGCARTAGTRAAPPPLAAVTSTSRRPTAPPSTHGRKYHTPGPVSPRTHITKAKLAAMIPFD